jgi:hypothetical protein
MYNDQIIGYLSSETLVRDHLVDGGVAFRTYFRSGGEENVTRSSKGGSSLATIGGGEWKPGDVQPKESNLIRPLGPAVQSFVKPSAFLMPMSLCAVGKWRAQR